MSSAFTPMHTHPPHDHTHNSRQHARYARASETHTRRGRGCSKYPQYELGARTKGGGMDRGCRVQEQASRRGCTRDLAGAKTKRLGAFCWGGQRTGLACGSGSQDPGRVCQDPGFWRVGWGGGRGDQERARVGRARARARARRGAGSGGAWCAVAAPPLIARGSGARQRRRQWHVPRRGSGCLQVPHHNQRLPRTQVRIARSCASVRRRPGVGPWRH